MTTDGVDDVFIHDGVKAWRNHPNGLPCGEIKNLRNFIPPAEVARPEWRVARVFSAGDHKDLQCVEFEEFSETKCYDASGVPVSEESQYRRLNYANYHAFGNKQVPARFDIHFKDGRKVAADIEFSSGSDITREMFQPSYALKLSEIPANCFSPSPPQAISMPDPDFPRNGETGMVALLTLIDADGKIKDVQIQRSLSPSNDREAVNGVRRWLFKPATCEGKPVAMQINVEINFRR